MSKKPAQTEEPTTAPEELLTGVEGDENVNVTPVAPEEPAFEEPTTAPEVPAEDESPSDEEVAAENAKVAAEAQAAEKEKFAAEEAEAAKAPTPADNAGADIAAAITQGLQRAGDKNFSLQPDVGVEPRFSVVRSKSTGEIMLRENGTGQLSKVQLESIEEKESSIQGQEVEEV